MAALATFLTLLRWRALAYDEGCDEAFNQRIIDRVAARMGAALDAADNETRLLARACAHYRAQLLLRTKRSIVVFELLSIALLPTFVLWRWLKGLFQPKTAVTACDGVRLVFPRRFPLNPEIFMIPQELANDRLETRPQGDGYLSTGDVGFLFRLLAGVIGRGTPWPLQFVLKCAVDLAATRGALAGLKPRYVITYLEFSCSLTPLTWRLRQQDIATYNVMHGDKNLYAIQSFFEVDRCYCWNEFYVELFRREKARADFRVFQNPAFALTAEEAAYERAHPAKGVGFVMPHVATLTADGRPSEAVIDQIAVALNAIAERHPVTVRPHPFYPKEGESLLPKLSPKVSVVPAVNVPARQFILDHAVLIGTSSTLILEAAHLNRQIVVFRTPPVVGLAAYHFFYKLPNVTMCDLGNLAAVTMAAADGQPQRLRA